MDKKDYIVALDLGGSGVKLALGSLEDDTLRVEDIVYQSMPEDGVVRGQITNRKTVSKAISDAVTALESNNGIRISNVHIGISDKNIKCGKHDYFVYVSRKDGEIVKEDVNKLHDGMNNVTATDGIRILDRIPQCYLVYDNANQRVSVTDPVGRFGQKLASTFTFVFGSNQMIERYEQTLSELKPRLVPDTISAGPMLAIEAVTTPDERELGVVVVDLGHDTTDLCICQDNVIRYVRTIPIGSHDINNDIREYGIPVSRIESIKTNHGVAMADMITEDVAIKATGNIKRSTFITTKRLATLIECRLKDITNYIAQEIADSGYKNKLLSGIVLTGGGANLTGIDKMMERELDMDVRISKPNFHILAADGKEELLDKLENATVVGMLQNAANKRKFNHVEIIRSISPVRPVKPEIEEKPVTPIYVTPKREEKPVEESAKEEQKKAPSVDTTTKTDSNTNPSDNTSGNTTEKSQNEWLKKIKEKTNELLKKDNNVEEDDSNNTQTTDSNDTKKDDDVDEPTPPKKQGFIKFLIDKIFPADVEGDEYDE